MNPETVTRRAALILAGITLIEGSWVALTFARNGVRFWRYLGFATGRMGNLGSWLGALAVTAAFVVASVRLPSVRAHLARPSWLKLLALLLAVAAGILEEVVFRKVLMDALFSRGFGGVAQVVLSGLAFGAAHGVWGLMGRSARAALGATIATGVLGAALALVYIAAGRSVAPCVVAHFVVNLLIEPGLVLAAVSGEMSGSTSVRGEQP